MLRLALIGQGRSGRDIHGSFLKTAANIYFEVAAVVEADPDRRARALNEYAGCSVYGDYRELFGRSDIDLVVNVSYSEMHYKITKDLLEHGFNVLVDKPMARNYYECCDLMKTARDRHVMLSVFQQSFFAPHFLHAKEVMESGKLGDIKQISVYYNNFARRWDWQTLQCKLGGGVYNTGPHPIGIALALLDYDEQTRVAFSKLGLGLTSGDGEDYAKIILSAPQKPVVDIEISSLDAFSDFNIKIQGSRGTYSCTTKKYKSKYIVDGENPERPVVFESLKDEEGLPIYCSERLNFHEESGEFGGSPFTVAVERFYKMLYDHLTAGKEMEITAGQAARIINIIETVHGQNPLPLEYQEV